MEVDLMVDFLLDRVNDAPHYFTDGNVPDSITGGWIELSITYSNYLKLRQTGELDCISKNI
jgi:hypothetical protein